MYRCITRLAQMAAITITMVAILQEMEKPLEKRAWHGSVACVPYDFRRPSVKRLKDTYWNPYETHLLTPTVWGIGWGVNFHRLLEGLGIIREAALSEKEFLMPTPKIKEVLEKALEA